MFGDLEYLQDNLYATTDVVGIWMSYTDGQAVVERPENHYVVYPYLLYKGEVWSGDPLETHAELLYTEEVDAETHDDMSYSGEVLCGDPLETHDDLFHTGLSWSGDPLDIQIRIEHASRLT